MEMVRMGWASPSFLQWRNYGIPFFPRTDQLLDLPVQGGGSKQDSDGMGSFFFLYDLGRRE